MPPCSSTARTGTCRCDRAVHHRDRHPRLGATARGGPELAERVAAGAEDLPVAADEARVPATDADADDLVEAHAVRVATYRAPGHRDRTRAAVDDGVRPSVQIRFPGVRRVRVGHDVRRGVRSDRRKLAILEADEQPAASRKKPCHPRQRQA
jgi:hypothetical protein